MLSGSNVVNDGGLMGVLTNFGPFWRRYFSTGGRGLLEKL